MERFEVCSVNFNTPDLLERLLQSIRAFSDIQVRIIDGSNTEEFQRLAKEICQKYNADIVQLGYNIHHGRGLDYAISSSTLDWVLCVDSDAELLPGIFECLKFTHFIEGFAYDVGFCPDYVHPEFILVNVPKYKVSKVKFRHHGAPAVHVNESKDKLCTDKAGLKYFIRHGRGTCYRFGYAL